jgi:hypothetical protein
MELNPEDLIRPFLEYLILIIDVAAGIVIAISVTWIYHVFKNIMQIRTRANKGRGRH